MKLFDFFKKNKKNVLKTEQNLNKVVENQTNNEKLNVENSSKLEQPYSIKVLKPIELVNSNPELKITAGNRSNLSFIVEYNSKTPTKFYANVEPDAKNPQLNLAGAHYDNISKGKGAFVGNGIVEFNLILTAPNQQGNYQRAITLGLMDTQNWSVIYAKLEYPFTLVVV